MITTADKIEFPFHDPPEQSIKPIVKDCTGEEPQRSFDAGLWAACRVAGGLQKF